jgi:hypothetical protein
MSPSSKLNIIRDAAEIREGYLNVSDVMLGSVEVEYRMPDGMDDLVTPGTATEILALNVIGFYHPDRVDAILDHWVSLLAVGGLLTVGSVDLYRVGRALNAGHLSPGDANRLLYGNQKESWDCQRAAYTVNLLADALRSRGLEVTTRRHDGYRAVVTAERTS